jgi:hypothetical protein
MPLDPDDWADIIATAIKFANAPLHRRIAHLEQVAERIAPIEKRLGELETKAASVRWAGTFKPGKTFEGGALVTCGGSLWLAKCATAARPGSDPEAWVLIVKKGDFGVRNEHVQ